MFDSMNRVIGSWRASSVAMRIPVLVMAVFTAAWIQPELPVNQVAVKSDSRLSGLRQELAGVQMEMMDVMRPDGGALSQLREREECLKYALRAEEIKQDESTRCPASALFSWSSAANRCASSGETPRS